MEIENLILFPLLTPGVFHDALKRFVQTGILRRRQALQIGGDLIDGFLGRFPLDEIVKLESFRGDGLKPA